MAFSLEGSVFHLLISIMYIHYSSTFVLAKQDTTLVSLLVDGFSPLFLCVKRLGSDAGIECEGE